MHSNNNLPLALLVLLLLMPSTVQAVFGDDPTTSTNPILRNIVIEGNTHTDRELILRLMDLKLGEPFTRERMEEVWVQLEDVGYFAFVDMEFDESGGDGVVLRVAVEEDLSTAYGPFLRFSRRHKYQLGGWLEDRNLRGKGEILRLNVTALYTQQADLNWTHPWLLGVRGLELKLGLGAEQSAVVYRPTRQRRGNGQATVRWQFRGHFYGLIGGEFGQIKYRDDYSWPDPVNGASVSHPAATETHFTSRLALGFDSRSNPWYPSSGIFAELGARRWTGDDFESYTETSEDLRLFLPLPISRHVLALRAWGRQTDHGAQLDNTLFFGGPETVRGYPYASLEGDQGYLLSAEYRIPLFMMPISPKGEMVGVGLHLFADAGDTWHEALSAGRALQSWGGGAHLNIDRMQLRFEAAHTRDGDWGFEFMDHFNF